MCHGEQAERGDLWEPNLKHCHDGSWKCVKVGGSVIFKDEPRGKADRKQGQIWPRKNRWRKRRRRRMQSYFHLNISFTLLFIIEGSGCSAIATFSKLQRDQICGLKCTMHVKTLNWGNLSLITEDFTYDRLDSPSSKKLHPQQGKYHDEEKEKKKQADNGLHGAHEGHN